MPVTETQMAKNSEQKRNTQMALFQESPTAHLWVELEGSVHVEAVRILAQLLLNVRAGQGSRKVKNSEAQ
jgi:hypothetical protein